ncbi:MAG: nucleotidyltransferase domain-containing protein [Leptospiraceae bacterium]|nr:nucleotidyltransferase domain-containing protein [Leptospiraceae bacterium]
MNTIELKEILNNFFHSKADIERVFLFGSFARGDETQESDIDLLVDTTQTISLIKFIKYKLELEDNLHRKVDMLTVDGISPYILPIIEKEKVLVYDRKRQIQNQPYS